eukprot:GABW01001729.1.p1 GENE.GABW01001729.1~~GABW01001729.1.p1  ORF type:complete len:112 (-),score=3.76 GABW01001729.1:113-448(-)
MSKGRMMCIGTPLHLKRKFGQGYDLQLQAAPGHVESADDFVRDRFPSASVTKNILGMRSYEIPREAVKLSELFKLMLKNESQLDLTDWSVSVSSLEDVFLEIVRLAADETI